MSDLIRPGEMADAHHKAEALVKRLREQARLSDVLLHNVLGLKGPDLELPDGPTPEGSLPQLVAALEFMALCVGVIEANTERLSKGLHAWAMPEEAP